MQLSLDATQLAIVGAGGRKMRAMSLRCPRAQSVLNVERLMTGSGDGVILPLDVMRVLC